MPALDFTSADDYMTNYLLHHHHYWHLKQAYPNGQRITSAPFKAGGFSFSWRIHCYPNGVSSSCKDYIPIFIALDSKASEPVKVWSRFT
jgi:speckle-type POZ protein